MSTIVPCMQHPAARVISGPRSRFFTAKVEMWPAPPPHEACCVRAACALPRSGRGASALRPAPPRRRVGGAPRLPPARRGARARSGGGTEADAAPVSAAEALLRSAHVVAFAPSRDMEDDLRAAAGVPGARFHSVAQPWGVSDAFAPLNWPAEPVRTRPAAGGGPAAAAAAAAAFYGRHLLLPPLAAAPPCGEAAAAAAEAAAGVTDAADVALVVPWCCAARALELFAGARVRRFDSAADCWSSAVQARDAGAPAGWPLRELNVCATRYGRLVDATSDAELWTLPRGTVLLPRPAGGAAADAPAVDILLHGHQGARQLLAGLCRRLWRGRAGPLGDWAQAGARVDAGSAEAAPLLLLAAPASARPFAAGVELCALRLPVHRDSRQLLGGDADDGDDDAAWAPGERAAALATARAALAALAPTGLVPAGADVAPLCRALAAQADADVARAAAAGDPAAPRLVLPLPPAALLAALRPGGAVAAGEVALVEARLGCDPGRLRPTHRVRRCTDDDDTSFEALRAATARAHTLVFFCNHGSTRSPERAAAYARWLHHRAGDDTPPPRVRVLAGGMGALVATAAAGGEDMDALFATR